MSKKSARQIIDKKLREINDNTERIYHHMRTYIIIFVNSFQELLILSGEIAKSYYLYPPKRIKDIFFEKEAICLWLEIYNENAADDFSEKQTIQIIANASPNLKKDYLDTDGFLIIDLTETDTFEVDVSCDD